MVLLLRDDMADSTRFKDLQAEFKHLNEQVKQKSANTDERLTKLECSLSEKLKQIEDNTNMRLGRIEIALETLTRAPDARVEKLETIISELVVDHNTQNDTIARLNQLVSTGSTSKGKEPYTNGGPQQPHFTKQVKIDFLKFDGTDPANWIFRVEQYFTYYETPDPHRVVLAAINMEGDVVPWFQMLQKSRAIYDWASLTRSVEAECVPSLLDQPRSKLFILTQTGPIDEYCRQFMALANRAEGITDEARVDCFISGLKPRIKREVVSRRPHNL